MAQSPMKRRLLRALPDIDGGREPDERGATWFRWRSHEFRVAADGYVEEVGVGRNDLSALVERLLEIA